MNKVILVGRLTKDPELKFTSGSGIAVATFTLAVDRRFSKQDGQREADFIPVVCWRKTAELVANYTKKGNRIGVTGSIQVRKYQAADGSNRYATEVIADEIEFLEKKDASSPSGNASGFNKAPQNAGDFNGGIDDGGFTPVEEDEDIPF